MSTVISVEHLSKSYRLGQIGTGTLTNDMKVWFARKMGKPNPLLKIGQEDHGSREGETLWALKDVNFTVEQGEVLGIIGRNGAGKSTLLKILSRVTAPTSGCVKVKGRIASLLEVGTGFHPELTGRENIYLNGAILGMTRQEIARKFDEIVDFAEIEKFIDTPVKRYSSGMYVRLAFAVAAHLESEILLVDEVLAVGDAEFQKKSIGKMGDVSRIGKTVLLVSHNMATLQNLSSKVLLLNNGKKLTFGDPEKTILSYLSGKSIQNTGDLSKIQRTQETGLKFIQIKMSNQNGELTWNFAENQKVNIELSLMAQRRFSNVVIGFTFRTLNGQPIINLRSEDNGVLFNFDPGINIIHVEFVTKDLLSNSYSIDIGSVANGEVLDFLERVLIISIDTVDISGFGKTRQNGEIIYLRSLWSKE